MAYSTFSYNTGWQRFTSRNGWKYDINKHLDVDDRWRVTPRTPILLVLSIVNVNVQRPTTLNKSTRTVWPSLTCHQTQHHITLSTSLSQLTSALTPQHVLYAPPTPICCQFLLSTQPLLPAVSASLPPSVWNSLPAGICACSSTHTFRRLLKNPLFQSGLQFPLVAHTSA